MKNGKIKVDIYDATVKWFVGDKEEFIAKYKIPTTFVEDTEGASGLTIYYNGGHYLWAEGVDLFNVIPHECLHVVCDIFKVRGIEFDNDNHEHAAYLLGYLTSKILKTLSMNE